MESKKCGNRKTRVGTVVSDKMEKTIVVVVERRVLHPVYKKFVKSRSRYMAQDSENTARIGDHVMIEETRPISKNKCWRLKEIIRRAPVL
ncbi:MAG: 30S ribosomal protein S17 [Proteobacteria bacterium]|jgi:small subunit ribosomal protein S17|nr:30S ribosomal protein S17 [Pseudomonadota bacterium]MBQ4358705.1 30S ribosomal protein S17 [Pseudomonadota bacterium]MBQ8037603.1 30S ribosomal protein S17 [Pseudomonadota bacterium]MBQ9244510.1 30S ribosomal protein S17 [Pseudomonadota bacterium]